VSAPPADTSPTPASGGRPRAVAPLVAVIFALLVIAVVIRLAQAGLAVLSPYEIGYGETQVRLAAEAFARGEALYPPLEGAPCRVLNYPPFYPALAALFTRLLGPGFAPGRILSWLACLATALLLGALVRRETRRLDAALLAGGLYLASWNVDNVGHHYRIDSLAVMLSVCGLALALRTGPARWAGAICLVLALLTRQSAVAAGAAVVVWLAWRGERRGAVGLGALWIGLSLLAYAALTLATGGRFLTQAVLMLRTGWDPLRVLGFWGDFVRFYPALLALGAVAAMAQWRRDGRPDPFVLFTVFAAVVSLSVGKSGSGENYFLEPLAGLCLLTGVAWARLAEGAAARPLVGALLVVQLLVMMPSPRFDADQAAVLRAQRDQISALLPPAPAPVLSEDPGILLANGRTVWLLPYACTQAAVQGRWDQAPLVREIEAGSFALIILQFDPWAAAPARDGTYQYGRFTSEMVEALRARYRPVRQVGYYLLLAPAEGPSSAPH